MKNRTRFGCFLLNFFMFVILMIVLYSASQRRVYGLLSQTNKETKGNLSTDIRITLINANLKVSHF